MVLAHGSVRLHLSVTAERLSIRVPFLHVPEGGRAIALMRKSLEVSSHLVLASFRLEDDTLIVRYEDKLAGCHPAKLLDVMSCICKVVDSCVPTGSKASLPMAPLVPGHNPVSFGQRSVGRAPVQVCAYGPSVE